MDPFSRSSWRGVTVGLYYDVPAFVWRASKGLCWHRRRWEAKEVRTAEEPLRPRSPDDDAEPSPAPAVKIGPDHTYKSIALLLQGTTTEKQKALAILQKFSGYELHQNLMREEGIVALLLGLLDTEMNPQILQGCASVLSNISANGRNHRLLLENGAVAKLLCCPLSTVASLAMLLNLTANTEMAKAAIEQGKALSHVIGHLLTNRSDIQILLTSLKILANLSVKQLYRESILQNLELMAVIRQLATMVNVQAIKAQALKLLGSLARGGGEPKGDRHSEQDKPFALVA